MEIETTYPPNFDLIKTFLPAVAEDKHAIFCYGKKIYNPHSVAVTPDRELHEAVHAEQQGKDPDAWYQKYLTDPEFRLKQELEAYGRQYSFIKKNYNEMEDEARKRQKTVHASKAVEWGLEKMAEALASDTYGKMLNHNEARSKIRNFAKYQT